MLNQNLNWLEIEQEPTDWWTEHMWLQDTRPGYTHIWSFGPDTNNFHIMDQTAGNLRRLFISSEGDIGFGGTTSPGRKVDILTTGDPQLRLSINGAWTDFKNTNEGYLEVTPSGGVTKLLTAEGAGYVYIEGGGTTLPGLSTDTYLVVGGRAADSTRAYINIIGGASAAVGFQFGDPNDANAGQLYYNNSTDRFDFYAAANAVSTMAIMGTGVRILGQLEVTGNTILEGTTTISEPTALSHAATKNYIDLHSGDTRIHYLESSIDHTNIQSIGTNTHTFLMIIITLYSCYICIFSRCIYEQPQKFYMLEEEILIRT